MVTEPVRKAVSAFFAKFAKEDLSYFFWFLLGQIATIDVSTGSFKIFYLLN